MTLLERSYSEQTELFRTLQGQLRDRWYSIEMLEESNATESVRQVLKKNELKPWLNESWVIPLEANAEFVCQMEDILQLYTRPYDPDYPLVCFDESSKQLISEVRKPLPAEPG
jgi:hypothetical protein